MGRNGEEIERCVSALEGMASTREGFDQAEHRMVLCARSLGLTWEQIGAAYGISRQAARQRFVKPRVRRTR